MLRTTIFTGALALAALVAGHGLAVADETVIEKRTVEQAAPERVIEERTVRQAPPAVEKRTEKTVVTKDNDNDNENDNKVDVEVDVDD
jgi:hypothetical protein